MNDSADNPVAGSPAPHATMQCMEVWGGNGVSDNGVTMPGIDVWVFSRPHQGDAEGGDIHYVSSCGTGRISRLLVADVAGHGTQVAELASTLRTLMRRYVNYVDQSRFVGVMNQEFARLAQSGRFATAVVATYWAPTDYLVACNAGHPRPLVYSSRKRQWTLLDADRSAGRRAGPDDSQGAIANLPLGIIDESQYEQFAVRMRRDDLVVIYTDSLMEARTIEGPQLGEQGLLDLVATLDSREPARLARDLFAAVVARCGGVNPDDDATILVLRPNGVKPRYSLAKKLATQMRFLAMLATSWRRGAAPVPWPELRLENILGPVVPKINRRWGGGAPEL